METSRLLAKIENCEMVLPEFQREFTWSRQQSLELIDSLLKNYPTGSLLVWRTADVPALKNMPEFVPDGRVDVLLDGQQRLTALYMLLKNRIPPYYSDKDIEKGKDPRNLYINLKTRALMYYNKIEMDNNPCWIPLTDCFIRDKIDIKSIASVIAETEEEKFEIYSNLNDNLSDIKAIKDIYHPIMYVQEDANLKHALKVFDRVNSNGTPLTEADIALAHMCSSWPDTRRVMKQKLSTLEGNGFSFDLTFLIRAMNAVINGRAEYKVLHEASKDELVSGWRVLDKTLDFLLNFLRDRAFLYESGDLNTYNVLIPLIGYLSQNQTKFRSEEERKKLLFWMYAALYQTRYSGSVDQKLESDLKALSSDCPIDELIATLREDHGDFKVTPENLDTRGVGHPLYNMSCIVSRALGGVDWSNGLALENPIGKEFSIEQHHIFPQTVLRNAGYDVGKNLIHRKRVNEIANRVPLTRTGNMDIFKDEPSKYLPLVQKSNPGNLEKFMIPMDTSLWEVENYESFLKVRRTLIAQGINDFMKSLISKSSEEAQTRGNETINELVTNGESENIEFKSTLRWHIHSQRNDKSIENAVLKVITSFLNCDGGTVLIGIDDKGTPLGLDMDNFENQDKMMLHLSNILKDRLGARYSRFIRMTVEDYQGFPVLRVECRPSTVPAYLKVNDAEYFYVRSGPSAIELRTSEIHEYVQSRFFT